MEKNKKIKLFKKKLRFKTLILAFILKAYPFIEDDNKENYCEKINNFVILLKGNYIELKNYFNKYWKNCELFNFTKANNEIIKNRTNNICETFHSKLNRTISHYHPKMSFLINQLKNITKSYYEDYIDTLSKNKKKNEPVHYLANDIFNFI